MATEMPAVGDNFNPDTPEGRAAIEMRRQYFEALGSLIAIFPAIEMGLFATLGALSGVPLPMGRALFSDTRIDAGMRYVKRVLKARKIQNKAHAAFEDEITAVIDEAFVHLQLINSVRNHIVHHGTADFHKEEPIISNLTRALTKDVVREIKISAKSIREMMEDLGKIEILLTFVTLRAENKGTRTQQDKLLETAHKMPWRYQAQVDVPPAPRPKNK